MNLRALFTLPEQPKDESLSARLKSLESRIEHLELARAEHHINVLNVAEKVMKQLEARERMRDRAPAPAQDEEPEQTVAPESPQVMAFPRRRHIRAW